MHPAAWPEGRGRPAWPERRGLLALPLVLALLVAGAGCGGDEEPAGPPAPPPEPGYTRTLGEGFTIDMPAGWRQPLVDPAAFDQTAAALRDKNPELAQALEAARSTMEKGSRLFAIDPSDGSTVNLIVAATNGRSLDALVAQAITELQGVGVTSPRQEKSTLGGEPAIRLNFSLPVRGQSGTLDVPEAQYYAIRDGQLFILTLFGSSPRLPTVAESLRFR